MNKIIYLDAAASSQKPLSVIDAEVDFLKNHYANSGRGVCDNSNYATDMVARCRDKVAQFINADKQSIIFTSGATDSLNRIANMLDKNSFVMVSDMEHHSARLPFEIKNKTVLYPLDNNFNIDIKGLINICKNNDVNAVVITAMSNVLGMPQDVKKIVSQIHSINPDIITIIDASQYVSYMPIDVKDWDCDALVFSGHKIGSDTGIGILYLKDTEKWKTDKFGGGMVKSVKSFPSELIYADGPDRFEAGTLPLTQISGLMPAIDSVSRSGQPEMIKYLYSEIKKIDRIKIISNPEACILTFVIDGMHCFDFANMMGAHGICVRAGNMCASWLHAAIGFPGTIRISTGNWNNMQQMEKTIAVINKILEKN